MRYARRKVVVAVGLAVVGVQVPAQDLRVSVTGTNIKRTDTETAAPIETITREDIQASGLQTISDVLRQITANNNGLVSPSFTNGFSASGSAVSLRGLGPQNTLVLLNGRRLANFGLAEDAHASYVDLQQIPFDMVERIEVLKDGASAIYGSDAVAGVINVILRQQYTGVTATATAGTLYNGSGNQYKGAVTFGTGDITRDGYNAFMTLDAQRQDAIAANRGRQYAGTNDLRFMGYPDLRPGNFFASDLRASQLGNVLGIDPANPNGPFIPGTVRGLPGACAPANQDGSFCRWEVKDYMDLLPAIDRYNVFARGTVRVAEDTEAYAEASYFHVRTDIRFMPPFTQGLWVDPSTNAVLPTVRPYLPIGHPDNPFNAAGLDARLLYVDAALGQRNSTYDTGTQRYLAGVKGTHGGWDWDVAALYIRSQTDITQTHEYQYDRLLQGLAGTGPFGYYRIGSAASLNNPAIYDWIAPTLSYSTLSQNTIVDAKASRDVGKLPGGALAVALGYEFRREELNNPGLPGTATGNVVGGTYVAVSGSRNVNAVYGEIFAPLLPNLEVTAAVRFDDYSDAGNTTNPKVGVKWTPTPGLVLRGTWETAFRAPGLYESANVVAAGATGLFDPVRCAAVGECGAPNRTFFITGAGQLLPETSTTWTAGVIWEPVPGLAGTLDYWNIRTRRQIVVPNFQGIVDNPGSFPTATVGRDTNDLPGIPNSGTLLYVSTPYQNASVVATDGIDLDVTWKQNFGNDRVTAELQWTHVFAYDQTFGDVTFRYAGTQGPYEAGSAAGAPRDRANLILGWTRGPLTVTGTVRYVSGYEAIRWQGDPGEDGACVAPIDTPGCHVASFTTLDLSAQYTGFRNWQLFGSIINVFNRLAPFAPGAAYGQVNYNYNWAYSGATGTQFNLGFRYTFD